MKGVWEMRHNANAKSNPPPTGRGTGATRLPHDEIKQGPENTDVDGSEQSAARKNGSGATKRAT